MSQRQDVDLVKLSVNDSRVDKIATRLEQAKPECKAEYFWPEQYAAFGSMLRVKTHRIDPS